MSRVGTVEQPIVRSNPKQQADRAADLAPLEASLAGAETLLRERGRLYKLLADSHDLIPALLQAKVNAAAASASSEVFTSHDKDRVTSHLSSIEDELTATVRQRNGAVNGLLAQEQDLQDALSQVEQERQSYAAAVVTAFEIRYERAFEALQALWAEGDALSKSLRAEVPMALPVAVTGAIKACFVADADTKVTRILPADSSPTAVDPLATRIGTVLDGLDGALAYAKGLAATLVREKCLPVRTGSTRPFDPSGLFRVLRPFRDAIDNLEYQPGVLVDASLLGHVSLQRAAAVKLVVLESAGQSSNQAVA